LLTDAKDKTVLSDGIAFDQCWLEMLFDAVKRKCLVRIVDVQTWIGQQVKLLGIEPQLVLARMTDFDEEVLLAHRAKDDVKLGIKRIEYCLGRSSFL
jgi:hypothetical protein